MFVIMLKKCGRTHKGFLKTEIGHFENENVSKQRHKGNFIPFVFLYKCVYRYFELCVRRGFRHTGALLAYELFSVSQKASQKELLIEKME